MTEKPPQEPNPENVELEIEGLLETLYNNYAEIYDELGPELQSRWYDIEMEAGVGQDRENAKTQLEEFLKVLEDKNKKEK